MSEMTSLNKGVVESEEFWDRFTASASIHPANLYRYTLISDLVAGLSGARGTIMDLGCGNGVLLAHFHDRGLGGRLVGCDGSAAIIKRNQGRIAYAEFHQADLQVPERFPSLGKADVVTCSEVVEHMPDYLPAFRIAHQCLNPGGHFILTTQGGKRRRHDVELLGHLRHYDLNALASEVAAAGFEIIRKQQAGWPALSLQKIAASLFMKQVSRELASHDKPSFLFRMACKVVGCGLVLSSKRRGPQLVIMARKPLD
jgi:2-polyprenyl-3-methyl-5-hydroxy-6-metoxy-1,4-benzoquinol methylase